MNISLYTSLSDKNVVDKELYHNADISGTLREDCSIINPVLKVEGLTAAQLKECNYLYIPDFGRYYFINNITLKGKLYELNCHVDVLSSFKDKIRDNTAIISRQQRTYNLYLRDGAFKCEAGNIIQIKQFGSGFNSFNFIFCVAG